MPFSAIILDFDGTLLDTETPIFETWRDLYERHGQTLEAELWATTLGTHGTFDPIAELAERTARPLDRDEIRRRVSRRIRRRCAAAPLLPGVEAVLAEARRLGLKIAVASSSSRAWVGRWLDHHRLRGAIDFLCNRDDVERVKPAPDLFLLAAAELGVEPAACVVFEDSPNGILAARCAGMRCVAVPNALTRLLEPPAADLVLGSLDEMSLAEVLGRLEREIPPQSPLS